MELNVTLKLNSMRNVVRGGGGGGGGGRSSVRKYCITIFLPNN